MSCQNHGGVVKALQHLEEASSGDGIYTSGGLIHEFDLWAANERHGTNQLSLVSSAQIGGLCVSKWSKVKSLLDIFLLEIDIALFQSFYLSDEIKALINS